MTSGSASSDAYEARGQQRRDQLPVAVVSPQIVTGQEIVGMPDVGALAAVAGQCGLYQRRPDVVHHRADDLTDLLGKFRERNLARHQILLDHAAMITVVPVEVRYRAGSWLRR